MEVLKDVALAGVNRAYSVLEVKSLDEDSRVITGWATTPTPDRMGDIVEPLGVSYKNPLPLLKSHKADQPVGTVKFKKPTKEGIEFEARIPKIQEPPTLKDRVDTAWAEIKAGLVRGVSIGFRSIEHQFLDGGGVRFTKSEVVELSLVPIPANAEANIQTIKSFDAAEPAAPGSRHPQVSIHPAPRDSSEAPRRPGAVKTISEQINDFRATLKLKVDRMTALLDKSGEAGLSLDAAEQEEYDNLAKEVDSLEAHVKRLTEHEARMKSLAAPLPATPDPAAAARARSGPVQVVSVQKQPPGTAFTRYVMTLAAAKGNIMQAVAMAEGQKSWVDQTPEVLSVLKAAVAAGTTTDPTWAAPLVEYRLMVDDFIEYLRPRTIIGRITSLRRVPFKIKVPRQTAGSSVNWVGEGKVKPVSKLAFDSITLEHYKIAGIIALTEELVRFSNPSAEALVREDLAAAIIEFMDREFTDPTKAEAAGVSPASITNGVTPVPASGTTPAALKTDLKNLLAKFTAANLSLDGAFWLMTQTMAASIALMENSLGQPSYPSMNMQGGTLLGLPVIASENMVATGGSPANGSMIVLASGPQIMLADDGEVLIDSSREASLQMDSAPDSPATGATTLVSLWQHNMVGVKAERFINWKKRNAQAVQYIAYAKYTG